MPEVSLNHWKAFIEEFPRLHLLQTGEWGELKAAFGWEVARVVTKGGAGAQILFRRLPFGLRLAYIPKGPVGVVTREIMDEIDLACQKRRAFFVKVELDRPDSVAVLAKVNRWKSEGWPVRLSPQNIQPPRSILVDLRLPEEDILMRMKQKTRYNIRLAQKKGVTVRSWDDIPAFHRMMLTTGSRDGFGVHSLDYYRTAFELFKPREMCELLVAEYEGRPLAALMIFAFKAVAYYIYGASTDEERNRMPTYLLQWEAMRWAKSRGCETYDLWGVPDEDETALEESFETRGDGLWGVYRFKRGFGGQVRRGFQALDRPYNPFLYGLYHWIMTRREGG